MKSDRMRRGLRALMFAFAGLLGPFEQLQASAAATVEDLAAMSGVSTTESESLDKEADELLEDAAKAIAEAATLSRAAGAKIDQKALLERLKKGDRSALSEIEQTPESQRASELFAHANDLVKQAYQKADEAAVKRAHAALEQRCLVPSAASGSQSGDAAASPFLCSAVGAGGSKASQNDPLEQCSCARRYLNGLQGDYDGLQERVQGLVAKIQQSRLDFANVTADIAQFTRSLAGPKPIVEGVTTEFEIDARGIQRKLAFGRISQLATGRGPPSLDRTPFLLSRSKSYEEAMTAARGLWTLLLREAGWQRAFLDRENEARRKQFLEAFGAADEAVAARHPEFHTKDDATGFVADIEPLAKRSDQADYRYIEDTAESLRAIAARLNDAHRRLTHDTKDWKNYATKYGETRDVAWAIDPMPPISFEIHPSRLDPVHCCLRIIRKGDQEFDDPETHLWAHFPQDLLQKYPEMTLNGQADRSPWVTLIFSIDSQPTLVTGIASGAGATQRP